MNGAVGEVYNQNVVIGVDNLPTAEEISVLILPDYEFYTCLSIRTENVEPPIPVNTELYCQGD